MSYNLVQPGGCFFLTGRGGGAGGGVFVTLVTLERVLKAGGDGTDGGLGLGLNEDNEGVACRSGDKGVDEIGVPCLDDGLADVGTGSSDDDTESFWRLSPRFPAYSRKTDRIV